MPISPDVAQNLLGELFHVGRVLRANLIHTDAGQLLPGGLGVLSALETTGPCRQVDLAAGLCITPSAMSRHITDLAAAGYISRQADPSDGRATLVQVTPEGRELLYRVRDLHTQHLQETLTDWTEEDAEQAYRFMRRLRDSLNSRARCGAANEKQQISKVRNDV
ncbi:MarR family winged helix-turn-helix transcriptional regulator [Nocardia paucivorans]|uniref:MarR family winged helix-turn-helix transcriptional regulator n=1 Tax=Nocardia paucivorans TaxID=114259 RepID=UPI000594736E|nr:MarR family winged helix-turn-helix transcriptional regulator [Nocardia paucivorans]